MDTDSSAVVWLSLYLHLLDQYNWGLLEWGEVTREARQVTEALLRIDTPKIVDWIFTINFENRIETELIESAKRSILYLLSPGEK